MSASARRPYLDWLRGVGVLIMIEGHTLDAWTRPSFCSSRACRSHWSPFHHVHALSVGAEFLTGGAAIGMWLELTRDAPAERRMMAALAAVGIARRGLRVRRIVPARRGRPPEVTESGRSPIPAAGPHLS